MKMQHKFIVIPLAVMLLVGTASLLMIESYLEKQLHQRTISELQSLAAASLEAVKTIEAVDLKSSFETNPEALQKRLFQSFQNLASGFSRSAEVRITYIDANGQVLGDSGRTLEQLKHVENHGDRKEVITALNSGRGMSQRYSDTLNQDVLYVAIRSNEAHSTDDNSHLAHPLIARAARPITSISTAISELRNALLLIGILSLFALLALGFLGVKVLTKAVNREQKLLEQRVDSSTNEISILQTLGGLLNACSTLAEAGEIMSNVIPSLLPDFKGGVSIIKSSRNRLDSITHWGGDWPGLEKFLPTDCWALRKGHQYASYKYGIQIHCNHWHDLGQQEQTFCIPLLAQGETIGVLHFVMGNSEETESNSHLLNAIAEQIGLTLANIQLRDNLREQAIRDPLTGLYNRRYMLETLDQAHSRAERANESIAILMIDLDHFKRFNDNFGHDAGDHVLKAAANILKESIRQEDIACRFGGEEFCIVCPSTDKKHAQFIAERIGTGIRSLELKINQLPLGTVTASIGIAMYPEHADAMQGIIKIADEALYKAKEEGRDRIIVAESKLIEADTPSDQPVDLKSA